eukprot:SAG31_NODE_4280_length_3383_cov_3.430268_4_plen_300_part_00
MMLRTWLLCSLTSAALRPGAQAVLQLPPPAGLWPVPRHVVCSGDDRQPISANLSIVLRGAGAGSDVAANATMRYRPLLTGYGTGKQGGIDTVIIAVGGNATLGPSTDYSYSIELTAPSHSVAVSTASVFGVAYALETLEQLIDKRSGRLQCATVQIIDFPEYEHRGLMLDPGSRFVPVHMLKRQIMAMSAVKMNVLHLHLSEGAWRLRSERFPQLGRTMDGRAIRQYTAHDIKDLVEHARLHGVRIGKLSCATRSSTKSGLPDRSLRKQSLKSTFLHTRLLLRLCMAQRTPHSATRAIC